jgi:hypothetical protein
MNKKVMYPRQLERLKGLRPISGAEFTAVHCFRAWFCARVVYASNLRIFDSTSGTFLDAAGHEMRPKIEALDKTGTWRET